MERGGEEMKGNPTMMRRNMLVDCVCECVCACMAWVLISFPKIPLPYNPEANSNSVRSVSLCLFLSPCLSLSPLHLPMHCYTIVWLECKTWLSFRKGNTCSVQSMGF